MPLGCGGEEQRRQGQRERKEGRGGQSQRGDRGGDFPLYYVEVDGEWSWMERK